MKNKTICKRHLKVGDVLTHTRCLGMLEEHYFTGWEGIALCGKATGDTKKMLKISYGVVNDIHPNNVTHINRVPIEDVPFYESLKKC